MISAWSNCFGFGCDRWKPWCPILLGAYVILEAVTFLSELSYRGYVVLLIKTASSIL